MTPPAPNIPGACDICGSVAHRRLFTRRFSGQALFPLWRCRSCGLVFNWPRLPSGAIEGQYDQDYYVFKLPPARRWMRAAQLYLEYLLPLERLPSRRLLEIGCARGDLLAIARERGWEVQGVELSRHAGESARAEHGLPIRIGTLDEHAAELRDFDVVIATDVIEHVPTPLSFVRGLRNTLCPGGMCLLETPNWGGTWRHVGGRRWLGINPFHVFLFDARSLVELMRRSGFLSCRLSSTTHAAYSSWSTRPELEPLLARLPAGLRWRANRWLDALTTAPAARRLLGNPPDSLPAALRQIEAQAPAPGRKNRRFYRTSGRLNRDNLAVLAIAGDTSTSSA